MVVLPDLQPVATRAGLEALLGLPSISDDLVRLRLELLVCQLEALDRLASSRERLEPNALVALLDSLHDRLAAAGRDVSSLQALREHGRRAPAELVTWVEAAATDPGGALLHSTAADRGLPPEALLFFGRVLAAPLLHAWVRARPLPASSTGPTCPCCGSPPAAALVVGPDGRRLLGCGLCAARWDEPRLSCPACGTCGTLRTLRTPERPRAQIESCTACRAFLTTIDLREGTASGSAGLPLVEVTGAMALELVAEREGLAPPPPYVALL